MGVGQIGWKVGNPDSVFQRLMDETLELIPVADGVAIEIAQGDILSQITGSGLLCRPANKQVRVAKSTSGLAMRTGVAQICHEVSSAPNSSRALWRELGINSMVYVPLLRGHESIGVLLLASSLPYAFSPQDVLKLSSVADFVASVTGAVLDFIDVTEKAEIATTKSQLAQLEPELIFDASPFALARTSFITKVLQPETQRRVRQRRRIEKMMRAEALTMVAQPVMSLENSRQIVEVEALARFHTTPARAPDYWFGEAASVGLGVALELFAIRRGLEFLARLPDSISLAINAGPATFVSAELSGLLDTVDATRVIVELTEHTDIVDTPQLQEACENLRALGCRIAIDDTGTGFASLAVVLQVAPDIIKLDRELTRGIDTHPVRRALASALVTFGNEIGAEVIAEGIETIEQLNTLVDVGVRYGQGFYLAKPAPLEELDQLLGTAHPWHRRHPRFEREDSPDVRTQLA
ncbi:EAL domain-containing protein [Ferrimicrobium sp.]|uniref:sensor domain-containing phosphodiesterase n=1 Tax=Ferrimicrobium sp. TaxID=2926050 RepID=UPI00261E2214|nr:EAL domain-containing protein [Ferrimicrobium sp.]